MKPADPLIVLIGHGSPRPQWRTPLDQLVSSLGLPAERVRLAFMEHCDPSLETVASQWLEAGGSRILVLPLFLSSGGHVQRDIVGQIESISMGNPDLNLQLLPAFGEISAVRLALGSFIEETLAQG